MTLDSLTGLVEQLRAQRTELDDIEVKSAEHGTPDDLPEKVCAFANRRGGGVLIFGLDPVHFRVVGVGDPDKLQRDLGNTASNLEPPARIELSAHVLDGRVVLAAEVAEVAPDFRPCFIRARGPYNGAYVRTGDSARQMTQYEVYLELNSRAQPMEDARPVEAASLDDLDTLALDGFLAAVAQRRPALAELAGHDRTAVLRALGIVSREEPSRPTLAGLLVFGRYPQAFFPSLVVTVTAFAADRADLAVRLEGDVRCEGRLTVMLEDALRAVARFMRSRTVVAGLVHESLPEYPFAALREALVNAVAHRDYSRYAAGTQVQVRFLSDRVEIQSPGGLHGAVTLDLLGELGIQNTRNAVLARLLEELGPMENRGTGLAAMAGAMRAAGLAPPEFADGRTYFRVTLRNASLLDADATEWLARFADRPLTERQRLALAYVHRFGHITNREYRLLGQPDSRQATREIKDLVEQSLLEQRGLRGGSRYVLPPRHVPLPGEAGLDPDARSVLAALVASGDLGTGQLQQRTEMPRMRVAEALRRLAERGLVIPTTSQKRSPTRKYRYVGPGRQ